MCGKTVQAFNVRVLSALTVSSQSSEYCTSPLPLYHLPFFLPVFLPSPCCFGKGTEPGNTHCWNRISPVDMTESRTARLTGGFLPRNSMTRCVSYHVIPPNIRIYTSVVNHSSLGRKRKKKGDSNFFFLLKNKKGVILGLTDSAPFRIG